jgi:hypothetical protein
MSDRNDTGRGARPANLVLVERSGVKREIPQASAVKGMIEAEHAMHHQGRQLREVKLVSKNRAVARWRADELHWRRVA